MTQSPAASAPPSGLRFGMRDLLLTILLVAVGLAWWRDHNQQKSRQDLYQRQVAVLQEQRGVTVSATEEVLQRFELALRKYEQELEHYRFERLAWTSRTFHPSQVPPPSPEEFVNAVKKSDNSPFNELLQPFVTSARCQEAVPGLIELLADPSPFVRSKAVQALGRVRGSPSTVVPALVPLLDDSDASVQHATVFALGNVGSSDELAVTALRTKMNDDQSTLAVMAAVALDQIDSGEDIGPRLVALLKSPHERVRISAVGHLPDHVDHDEAERVLARQFASESDETVKRAMARALNRLQQEKSNFSFPR